MDPLSDLMGRFGDMKKKMEEATQAAQQKTVSATVGGGMVTVTANGKHEILRVVLDPVTLTDKAMLEDLIVAGCNQALAQAKAAVQDELKNAMQAVGLPPGLAQGNFDLSGLDLSKFFPK